MGGSGASGTTRRTVTPTRQHIVVTTMPPAARQGIAPANAATAPRDGRRKHRRQLNEEMLDVKVQLVAGAAGR
jgi:hypothetical protein